jgi:hypothetical protein
MDESIRLTGRSEQAKDLNLVDDDDYGDDDVHHHPHCRENFKSHITTERL